MTATGGEHTGGEHTGDERAVGDRPVDCAEALARLFEFLDHEVADSDGDRIRRHLADCEPCLTEYDVQDHLKQLVRRACHGSAPAELHVRIQQQLVVLRRQVGEA